MKRTIYPAIDDNYDPKSYSAEKIKEYHSNFRHISRLLMTSQVVFPLLALFWATLIVSYCTHTKSPYNEYLWDKKENIEGKWEMKVQLSITYTLSLLFSLYTTVMSAIAVGVQEYDLDEDIGMWYYFKKNTNQLRTIYFLPIMMVMEDSIVLLVHILCIIIVCCGCFVKKKCDQGIHEKCACLSFAKEERFWWMFAAYSIVAPIVNLSVHANYILIGFIHDQQHALGAGVFYAVLTILTIKVLRMVAELSTKFGKKYYCKDEVHEFQSGNSKRPKQRTTTEVQMPLLDTNAEPESLSSCGNQPFNTGTGHTKPVGSLFNSHKQKGDPRVPEPAASPPAQQNDQQDGIHPVFNQQEDISPSQNTNQLKETQSVKRNNLHNNHPHFKFFVVSIVVYIAIATFISLTFAFIAAVYIELPINNAFDEAPDRVKLIYTAVLGAVIAGLTYWLIRHKKAPAEVTLSKKTLEELAEKLRTRST